MRKGSRYPAGRRKGDNPCGGRHTVAWGTGGAGTRSVQECTTTHHPTDRPGTTTRYSMMKPHEPAAVSFAAAARSGEFPEAEDLHFRSTRARSPFRVKDRPGREVTWHDEKTVCRSGHTLERHRPKRPRCPFIRPAFKSRSAEKAEACRLEGRAHFLVIARGKLVPLD
jgi:hypothetical protein